MSKKSQQAEIEARKSARAPEGDVRVLRPENKAVQRAVNVPKVSRRG